MILTVAGTSRGKSSGWRYILPIALVAVLGTLISLGVAHGQRTAAADDTRLSVQSAVNLTSQAAARSLGSLRGSMAGYPGLNAVSVPLQGRDFYAFSERAFSYRDDVNYVGYAPRVDASMPVTYVYGQRPGNVEGFDLMSDEVSAQAIKTAKDKAATVMVGRTSGPVSPQPSVQAYTPLFRGPVFTGVVVASVDVATWMTAASGAVDDKQFALALLDDGVSSPAVMWTTSDEPMALGTATDNIPVSELQNLTLVGGPGPELATALSPGWPWLTLIGGLLLTAACCALVWWWLDARRIKRTADDLQQATNRLRFLAERDALTGLTHRDGLRSWLEDWDTRSPDRELVVLFIDLDGFKEVNTVWGHLSGDLVLRQMAHRLSALGEDKDTVIARISGDQFVVMRPVDMGPVDDLTTTVQTLISEPMPVSDREIQLSSSIGVVIRPEDGRSLDTLINNADLAVRAAKEVMGNSIVRFDPVMAAQGAHRRTLGRELRAAVRDPGSHFQLVFQPQVDMRSGMLVAAEALVRWRRGGQTVPPLEFLSLASEYGLMPELGRWVLEQSCRVVCQWRREVPAVVAVNVDAQQLDEQFADVVAQVLQDTGTSPGWLMIEITEAAAMGTRAQRELDRIRALGVAISIDDFGTGFSSLSRLTDLPTQQVKIDRAFVDGLGQSNETLEIVRTIVALARALGLQTLAEGVETVAQAQTLLMEGVEIGQGFLFAPPLSADECLAMWRRGVTMPQLQH
jgi:diguanylate cyclase (GGDEF)-like protein